MVGQIADKSGNLQAEPVPNVASRLYLLTGILCSNNMAPFNRNPPDLFVGLPWSIVSIHALDLLLICSLQLLEDVAGADCARAHAHTRTPPIPTHLQHHCKIS